MIFLLKAIVLLLALFLVFTCYIAGRIAIEVRDYFIALICGCGAIGTLALVIYYIF